MMNEEQHYKTIEENRFDIQEIIETAVFSAHTAGIRGMDEKIEAAINLAMPIAIKVGTEIGAKVGAEIGAQAAIKAVEQERRKEKKQQLDKRFHNTKLLIRKYRQLNNYYKNAVYDMKGAEDEKLEEIMSSFGIDFKDENLHADSIKRNYLTTRLVMTHVKKMLSVYKNMCEQNSRPNDKRRWRILYGLYLSETPETAEELAQRERISTRMVYDIIDSCIPDLTILFFGISGIEEI